MRMPKRVTNASRAQAMVEFALIATVLLMLIFIVIEAARILWAWNTVQNAAREGIRYAITGQSEGTAECPVEDLPKFDNSTTPIIGRDLCSLGDNNRVASIVSEAHVALSGLPLNEFSDAFEDDRYYNIEVWGVDPEAPSDDKLLYDFGGKPNYPVVVRVTYRVPIITPLLRPIASSVPVFGQVALNNENFGSLGGGGDTGSGLPPELPPIPTPGITPSPTPTSTPVPITVTLTATPTVLATDTVTPTPAICPVSFVAPPIAGDTSVLVTGEPGATVEVYDISTVPPTLLATTVLLERSGYACAGFADFVPSSHPALSSALIAGHFIEVIQFVGGVQHSTDLEEVLPEPPTPTPTHTSTIAPTPTETATPSVTPTNTPGSPFITLTRNCGGSNTIGDVSLTVLGFNWADDEDITLFWVDSSGRTSLLTTILAANHAGSFSYSQLIKNVSPDTYTVLATSASTNDTAEYEVPCTDFEPTPVTSTPTHTPRPIDLIVGQPQLLSSRPITAYTPVDFTVVITNQGGVDANSQFFVDVYIDPSAIITDDTVHIPIEQSSGYSAVSSLPGGESRVITITSPLGFENAPDPHRVYAMVDSAGAPGIGQIPEERENNNINDNPLLVTDIILAATPTPTPTVDPSGDNIIAGTVNSRVIELATQFRAVVRLIDNDGIYNTIESDENGYYEFLNVPDGTYSVQACIEIDGVSYSGVRAGITPPNTVANVYMFPGGCADPTTPTNQPPVVTHPGDQITLEGNAVSLQIVASDNEGDTLTYSALGLPPGLSINPTTGRITGTPPVGSASEYAIGVTVDDGTNQTNVIFNWTLLEDELRFETIVIPNVNSGVWKTVTTSNTYVDMVAVCSIRYANNTLPQVIRMRNARGSSFEIRLQNPSLNTLGNETVDCMVLEAGVWSLPDGRKIEGQKYTATSTFGRVQGWDGNVRAYGQSYTNPVVFGQVMSFNDTNWSTFFSRGASEGDPPSSSVLRTGKHIGQDTRVSTRAAETVGYIVVESGNGTIDGSGYRVALGSDSVRSVEDRPPYIYAYVPLSAAPTFGVVTQSAMGGNDGSWAYTYSASPFTASTINVALDEDQIGDSERRHVAEPVSYFITQSEVVIP